LMKLVLGSTFFRTRHGDKKARMVNSHAGFDEHSIAKNCILYFEK
jgi:hypothetical protein